MEFKVGSGYCDLNVCSSGDAKSDRQLLRRAFELGYETVALTLAFDQKNLGTGKKASHTHRAQQGPFSKFSVERKNCLHI